MNGTLENEDQNTNIIFKSIISEEIEKENN